MFPHVYRLPISSSSVDNMEESEKGTFDGISSCFVGGDYGKNPNLVQVDGQASPQVLAKGRDGIIRIIRTITRVFFKAFVVLGSR